MNQKLLQLSATALFLIITLGCQETKKDFPAGYSQEFDKVFKIVVDQANQESLKVILPGASASEFQVLNNYYSRDNDQVFFCHRLICQSLKGVDPEQFEVLSGIYAISGNQVYFGSDKLKNVNVGDFQLLEFPYARDDQHFYRFDKLLLGAELDDFDYEQYELSQLSLPQGWSGKLGEYHFIAEDDYLAESRSLLDQDLQLWRADLRELALKVFTDFQVFDPQAVKSGKIKPRDFYCDAQKLVCYGFKDEWEQYRLRFQQIEQILVPESLELVVL
jgi:hypothetical protein